ncbi:MAG TPA: universal stress protein [Acidimicrobiia bacterium]|nr:universal stress protein [Acidimicrobiia bacterium]
MFSEIVVGTNGSERSAIAVAHAATLARTSGARLHLVTATKAPGTVSGLEEQAAAAREKGVEAETHQAVGNPVTVVLDVAQRVDADLIVVGNRGMVGSRRLLGSVPNSLAHHARCAVMIVPTGS